MSGGQNSTRGILLTFIGGISFGFSGTCGQYLLRLKGADPLWLTSVRMLFAGIILMAIAIIKERNTIHNILNDKKDRIGILLFGIAGLMPCQFTYIAAISKSNAGTATVLQYLGPVLIMVFVCMRAKKRPSINELAAIILALFGTFLLATHGNTHSLAISKAALFWGLTSAFSYAFYSIQPEKLIKKYGSLSVTACGMFVGGVVLFFASRAWRYPLDIEVSTVAALVAIILVGTVSAFTLYLQGVKDIGPSKASLIACVEPVSATFFSALWLKNSFAHTDIIGICAIILCVILLSLKKDTKTNEKAQPQTLL